MRFLRTVLAMLAFGAGLGSPAPALARVGALMSFGAAFVNANELDRVADGFNIGSLSPGLDGGVRMRFGRLDRGVSGVAGLGVFWSRRDSRTGEPIDTGFRSSARMQITALEFPVGLGYTVPRGGGRLFFSAGVSYLVATARLESDDVAASPYFASDGVSNTADRSADGAGAHVIVAYERPTRLGSLGGGVLFRRARFETDPARGAANFDVDLTGVSLFLSLSVEQQ